MKLKTLPFLVLLTNCVLGQVTMEFRLNTYPDSETYNGKLILCNNSGKSLSGGYEIKCVWPSIESINYGVSFSSFGTESCDSVILKTESWETISNGSCKAIDIGGKYNPPMFLPPKGIGNNIHEVELVHSANSYRPEAVDAGPTSSEFYFNRACFISTANQIKLGEATLYEWGSTVDMFIPDNKKKWALANAHAHTLFTNLVGEEIVSINHYNASALNESRCGCESNIVNDPSATNVLSYQASTVNDGCFQISSNGWAQLNQFYPQMLQGLNSSSIVSGDYSRSCILKAYYDMTALLYWEKANCLKPFDAFKKTNDPYFAEEVLGMAFYKGFDPAVFKTIFNSNREAYIISENIVEDLKKNAEADNLILEYGRRIRNTTKQLDNNTSASWATGSPTHNTAVSNWRGWYNDDIYINDINAYLDEIKPMFTGVNWTDLKNIILNRFNEINLGNPIPFTQIGPIIDEIVLFLPAYDGNKGMSAVYHSDITSCSAAAISMSSCSKLCPEEEGDITVNLMGTPPFNFTLATPYGDIVKSNVTKSVVTIKVNGPGDYKVISYNDLIYSPLLNCQFTNITIEENLSETCLSVGTQNDQLTQTYSVYPNPTTGIVNISGIEFGKNIIVSLFSISGEKISEQKIISKDQIQININQPCGMYFMELKDESGIVKLIKLIKM